MQRNRLVFSFVILAVAGFAAVKFVAYAQMKAYAPSASTVTESGASFGTAMSAKFSGNALIHPLAPLVTCTTTSTNQVTCTGGAAASVVFASTGSASNVTNHASPYPATLTVPTGSGAGQIPAGATVSSITVQFNGLTAKNTTSGCSLCGSARDMGIVLQSPGASHSLQVMSHIGVASTSSVNNLTVKIQDGGPALPSNSTPWSSGGTFAPTNYDETAREGEVSPSYTPTGPASPNLAAPVGTSTMASTFGGAVAAGTWNVYLADDGGRLFGFGADVSFTSYDLVINYSAASTPSTTTLTPNLTSPFTSGAGSSDVLTATVTSGATGTVTFKDGSTNLTCAGGNPATISANQAVCSTTFATEGIHLLSAIYSGDSTFVTSTGTANIYAKNHATNVGTTYCNAGAITSNGTSDTIYSGTSPYPSEIFVGDGVNTDIVNSVSTVSVQLKSLSSSGGVGLRMLLVAPDGLHAYDFWDGPGANNISSGNYTVQDGSSQMPNAPMSPGTYGPTDINAPPTLFTPGPPSPAPQVPGSWALAAPAASATFQTAFSGAPAHGAWTLYFHNGNGPGVSAAAAGGWCINISPATGHPTTTTVTSSATPSAALGASTSFTATIGSSPTPSVGTVTFTENANPLAGAPNGGVATVTNGVATIATTGLSEGDHTVTASYHDSTNTFNDSFGTVTIRVDKTTSVPTLSGSTWSYCNAGAITIPKGQLGVNDLGPAGPNPSNITVANLPGTVSSMDVKFKAWHMAHGGLNLESLLVGPNGASAPTTRQTFDFMSQIGNNVAFAAQDTVISDAFTPPPSDNPGFNVPGPNTNIGPASYHGNSTYTTSPFFTLPGTYQYAGTNGAFTFNTGAYVAGTSGGVYKNTDANGLWSLYLDQIIHDTGSGMDGGWCVEFIQNPVTGTGTSSHTGPAPNNHMRQGGTGSVSFSLLNNGNGPTGVPDQAVAHAMTVVGTLPSGLTLGTLPTGSPWNCSAVGQTVTCTNLNAIAQGSSYSTLSIPVNVASNAATTATVSNFTFSGAGMTAGTFSSDTITIDPSPILAIGKAHAGTFTQGSTATWNLTVQNNSAVAAGATDGTTVTVTDTLPTGYTINSASGTNWSCSGSTTLTCTSTQVVAGAGAQFPVIHLVVNVPTNSPTSVLNTAKVFGGGDLAHTSLASAASGSDTVTVVQIPATVTINAGSTPQSALVSTAYATQLAVTVKDAGATVIQNESMTFTAATGANGQSGKFSNNTNTITLNTDVNGVASVPITANAKTGPFTVSAVANTGSVAAVTFNLTNQANTTISVSSSQNPTLPGQTVTFTATVASSPAGAGTPTGTVQFLDGGVSIGTCASVALSGLSAQCAISSLANGNHTITATYSGDGSFLTITGSLTGNPQVVGNTAVWTGATSSDWNTASNWNVGVVPGSANDVSIPSAGVVNQPNLSTTDVTINSLTLNSGDSLTITGGHTFKVNGTLTMNGNNIDATGGLLEIGNGGTIVRTSGVILGSLKKDFQNGAIPPPGDGTADVNAPDAPDAVFTFPTGSVAGYFPVDVTPTGGSTGSLTIQTVDNPGGVLSTLDPTKTLGRYWTVSGGAGITASMKFSYSPIAAVPPPGTKVNGNEANYKPQRVTGGVPTSFFDNCPSGTCVDQTNHFIFMPVVSNGSFAGNWTASEIAPTAAQVAISGRVLSSDGQAIRGVSITLDDGTGHAMTAISNAFGYYNFSEVQSGGTYILNATARGYTFTPRVISVNDQLTDVNLTALP